MKTIFFLLLSLSAISQTRFYLTQYAPAVSPASTNSNWNVTTGNLVWQMHPYVDRTLPITITTGAAGASSPRKMLGRQFVTVPLAAQTINGTLNMQQKGALSLASPNIGNITIYIRVINPDGSIAQEVGTTSSGSFASTTITNSTVTAFTFSNLSISTNQRICIDNGIAYSAGTNSATTGKLIYQGNASSGDLPVDNTTTTNTNPWIEFSQKIKFVNGHIGFF